MAHKANASTIPCYDEVCTSFDYGTCCVWRAHCTDFAFSCGEGFLLRPDVDDLKCAGGECDLLVDRKICCVERAPCSRMAAHNGACPEGTRLRRGATSLRCRGTKCDTTSEADVTTCCVKESEVLAQRLCAAAILVLFCVIIALAVEHVCQSRYGKVEAYQRKHRRPMAVHHGGKVQKNQHQKRVDKWGVRVKRTDLHRRHPRKNPEELEAIWQSMPLCPFYSATVICALVRGRRARVEARQFKHQRKDPKSGKYVSFATFVEKQRREKGAKYSLADTKVLWKTLEEDPLAVHSYNRLKGIRRNLEDGEYYTFAEYKAACQAREPPLPSTLLTRDAVIGTVRIEVANVGGMDLDDTITVFAETRQVLDIGQFGIADVGYAEPAAGTPAAAGGGAEPTAETPATAGGPGFLVLSAPLESATPTGSAVRVTERNELRQELLARRRWAALERRQDFDGVFRTFSQIQEKYYNVYTAEDIRSLWSDLDNDAAEGRCPIKLLVKSDKGYEGKYEYVHAERPNFGPLWRRLSPPDAWIFIGLGGQWFLGTEDEKTIEFRCDTGVIASAVPHQTYGRLPSDTPKGGWICFANGEWSPAPGFSVEVLEAPPEPLEAAAAAAAVGNKGAPEAATG